MAYLWRGRQSYLLSWRWLKIVFRTQHQILRLGPGTNCSAIFGKNGWARAIKQYRQLGWEIYFFAGERVFSLLNNSFNTRQESAMEDYIELSVMMQYNNTYYYFVQYMILSSLMTFAEI